MEIRSIETKRLDRVRDEFALVFYRWAQADAEKQAAQGFPLFSLLRDSLAANYIRAYQTLPREHQANFLQAMVKRTHERAVGLVGESINDHEKQLIEQFIRPSWENDRKELRASWNRLRLTPTDRSRLVKLVEECVTKETGGEFEKWTSTDFVFHRTMGPWTVSTEIAIKSKQNLGYEHRISLNDNPEVRLKEFTSITRWLGIGETNWNLMTPDEVEECAEAPIVLAKYFLDAVPDLLAKIKI